MAENSLDSMILGEALETDSHMLMLNLEEWGRFVRLLEHVPVPNENLKKAWFDYHAADVVE